MINITLIYPRIVQNTSPPLGLLYIANYLQSKGYTINVIDFTFEGKLNFDLFNHDLDSSLYAISADTTIILNAYKIAEYLKSENKNCKVLIGGCHATALPKEVLSNKNVDFVCIGEGEETTRELLEHIITGNTNYGKIKGLGYKKDNNVYINKQRELIKDLDSLPMLNRNFINIHKYLECTNGRPKWTVPSPSTTMITSRGCPFRCTFCSSHLIFGRSVRRQSVQYTINEIKLLQEDYKVKGILFSDDTFTVNFEWVKEFCNELIKQKIKIKWFCNARANVINEDIVIAMKKAGCTGMSFGVESGDQWVLDNLIKKDETLQQIEDAFKLVKKYKLLVHGAFMIGIPGETFTQMYKTIKFAKKLNPDAANFSIAMPFPGTELEDITKKYGTIITDDWYNFDFDKNTEGIIKTKDFYPEDIVSLKKYAYKQLYLNPKFIIQRFLNIRSYSDIKQTLNGLQTLLKRVK